MFVIGVRFGSVTAWIVHIVVACMGGCFGSHRKSEVPSIGNYTLKTGRRRRTKRGIRSKGGISEELILTNTISVCDMDGVQSRGSISSMNISSSNQTVNDPVISIGNTTTADQFVNHGLLLWNQTRQQWIGNKKKSDNLSDQLCEPKLSWDATYESLLGSNKPFPQPIPLPEMVDFLVDIWEQEGMYD
ncbi:uncharacterized protein LOC124915846 [Impatiens glandulifera]|uniref:uncharacterized protein LOC124915846 n=1 Tax=Impatiens glandulifera TaxID=253017 RepID=UPI001FB05E1A|nr:uncharacterized protein LOC124915846 [Impatiens glandulifera]